MRMIGVRDLLPVPASMLRIARYGRNCRMPRLSIEMAGKGSLRTRQTGPAHGRDPGSAEISPCATIAWTARSAQSAVPLAPDSVQGAISPPESRLLVPRPDPLGGERFEVAEQGDHRERGRRSVTDRKRVPTDGITDTPRDDALPESGERSIAAAATRQGVGVASSPKALTIEGSAPAASRPI